MNPYVIIGFLVALILVGITGFRIGEKVERSANLAEKVKAEQQAAADKAETEGKMTVIATEARTNYQKMLRQHEVDQQTMRVVYRKIKEEVPVYVTAKADAACVIPVGFVELYDRAYSVGAGDPPGGPPDQGPGALDRPSGVPLSRVADVSVDNAQTCRQWEDQARGCRQYVEVVEQFYSKLQGEVHACK